MNDRKPYTTRVSSEGIAIDFFLYRSCGKTGVEGLDKMFWADRDFMEADVEGFGPVMLFRSSPEELDFYKATARVEGELKNLTTQGLKIKKN